MRFNCESCGAKYQIADEKVAGKTVRMKCRKCAVVIQVRAEPGDTGVMAVHVAPGSGRSSRPPESIVPTALPSQLPPEPAAPGAAPAGPPRPSGPPRPRPSAARAAGRPLPSPSRPSSPGGSAQAGEVGGDLASRPDPDDEATVVLPRNVAALQAALAPDAQQGVPVDRGPAAAPLDPAASPTGSAPVAEGQRAAPPAAKTSPATSTVGGSAAAADGSEGESSNLTSNEAEWFVGVGGEPVGPVPMSYLEKELGEGRITNDSLVWRDKMSAWRPLSSVKMLQPLLEPEPEVPPAKVSDPVALMRVKEEAAAATDAAVPSGASPASEAAPLSIDIPLSDPTGPAASTEQVAASEPVASEAQIAAAEPAASEEQIAAAEPAASEEQVAASEPAASEEQVAASEPAASEEQTVESAFLAADATAQDDSARSSFEPGPDSEELLELAGIMKGRGRDRRKRRRGMHPMAWAFVAFSGAFGAVAAYKLIGTDSAQGPTVVTTAAPTAVATTVAAVEPKPSATAITLDKVDVNPAQAPKQPLAAGPASAAAKSAAAPVEAVASAAAKPAYDPNDPLGIPVDGPSVGGPSAAADDGGNGLLPAQVSGVVSRNRRSVSRRCLALVRAAGQTSAKVSVTITVGRSGSVISVSGGGGDKVPGLASCVMSRIRNWRFPTSGGTTKVAVPFTFIAQ